MSLLIHCYAPPRSISRNCPKRLTILPILPCGRRQSAVSIVLGISASSPTDNRKSLPDASSLTEVCNEAGGMNGRRASWHSGVGWTGLRVVSRRGKLLADGGSGFRHDTDLGEIDLSGL